MGKKPIEHPLSVETRHRRNLFVSRGTRAQALLSPNWLGAEASRTAELQIRSFSIPASSTACASGMRPITR